LQVLGKTDGLFTDNASSANNAKETGIDRDLLLLLLDDKAEGAWRPTNFHADPNPAEAVRCSQVSPGLGPGLGLGLKGCLLLYCHCLL